MEKNKKALSVLSTAAIAGLIVSAVSAPASAQASAIDINTKDGKVYEYQYDALKASAMASVLDSTSTGAALYNHFQTNRASIAAYYDNVNKDYVSFSTLSTAILNGTVKDLATFKSFMENTATPTTAVTASTVTADASGNITIGGQTTVSSVSPITATTTAGTAATLPSTVQVTLSDGTTKAANITWSAAATSASTYATAGTVTVNGTLADYNNTPVTATVTVNAAQLAVSSVSAIDATHIAVTFNNAVLAGIDPNSAETAVNYAIAGGPAISSAVLGTDGKTVTLTLGTALTNDTAYTVSVLKNVKDANGVALSATADYKTGIFFADHTAPTITSVAAQSNGDLKITFSERVAAGTPAVVVNGQSVTPIAPVDNTVTVPKANLAAANLTSGNSYSVVVSGYTDLATNALSLYNSTFTYNVVADTTAPTVTSLVAKDEKTLTLTFSEAINGAVTDGTTDNATALGLAVTKGVAATLVTTTATTTDGKVFTLNLPTTLNTVYDSTATPAETSAALAVTVNGYKDLALNVGAKYTQNVTVSKDTTAPTLVKAVYDGANFVFTFNKGLSADTAANLALKGITVVDSNGVAQTAFGAADFTAINAGDKTLTISNATLALPVGTYTFTFPKGTVNDNTLNGGNAIAQFSTTVTAGGAADTIAPTIATVASGSKDVITVSYSELVKGGNVAGSATDVSNYKLNGVALPANTVITLDAATKKIATITMPTGSVSKSQTDVLTTSNVQDLAGNVIKTVDNTVALTDSVAPVLQSAVYDSASNSIVLTFSEDVNGKGDEVAPAPVATKPVVSDFVVKVNGTTDAAGNLTVVNGAAENQIKITSSDMSFATGTITVTTNAAPLTGADAAGNLLTPNTTITLTR